MRACSRREKPTASPTVRPSPEAVEIAAASARDLSLMPASANGDRPPVATCGQPDRLGWSRTERSSRHRRHQSVE
jgi:hypothetical protein